LCFGPDVCAKFLETNKLRAIIRSHEVVREGFDWPFDASNQVQQGQVIAKESNDPKQMERMLLTIFSCSNYCNSKNTVSHLNFKLISLNSFIFLFQQLENVGLLCCV